MDKKLQRGLLLSVFLLLATTVIHGPSTTYAQVLGVDASVCLDVVTDLLSSTVCSVLQAALGPTSPCCALLATASACATVNGTLLQSLPSSSLTPSQAQILAQCGV